MAENFLNRLARNPYAPIDAASVTRIDEMGNGLDDWGNIIAQAIRHRDAARESARRKAGKSEGERA